MTAGWYSVVENDVTVTAQFRFHLNGAEVTLPPDFRLHVVTEGRHIRATIEHAGHFMSLADGLALAKQAKGI